MVAKHKDNDMSISVRLNLAKIHMVAKLASALMSFALSLDLAKIHMVAKPCVE